MVTDAEGAVNDGRNERRGLEDETIHPLASPQLTWPGCSTAAYINGARRIVDRIAAYFNNDLRSGDLRVQSAVHEGQVSASLPTEPPHAAEALDVVLNDFEHLIMPGVTHWQHPRFFAFYPCSTSFPAMFGDMLSGMINAVGFAWICSPAMTELEMVVMEWLRKALALPSHFRKLGVIQGTASEGTLVALISAREYGRMCATGCKVARICNSTAPNDEPEAAQAFTNERRKLACHMHGCGRTPYPSGVTNANSNINGGEWDDNRKEKRAKAEALLASLVGLLEADAAEDGQASVCAPLLPPTAQAAILHGSKLAAIRSKGDEVDTCTCSDLYTIADVCEGDVTTSCRDADNPAGVVLSERYLSQRKAGRWSSVDGRFVAYSSVATHASIEKGCRILGMQVRRLPELTVPALRQAVWESVSAGDIPLFVCVTLGTTGTCAFEDVASIGRYAAEAGLWVHVDAAYAGSSFICPELRPAAGALQGVASFGFNPHKWLMTAFDCSCLWTSSRYILETALGYLQDGNPAYYKNEAATSGKVMDYRNWQVPLGRRFRSLKLWFVLRMMGISTLQAHIRKQVALASYLNEQLRTRDTLKSVIRVLEPDVQLGLVCFHFDGATLEDRNERISECRLYMERDGAFMFTPGEDHNKKAYMRWAVCSPATEQCHIDMALVRLEAFVADHLAE